MSFLNNNNFLVPEYYHGFIYKTIFPNGKIYIGQTCKRVHIKYLGSGTKVHSYLKSNTDKELKREILRFCNNQKELDFFEMFYIKKFNSTNPKIGYNICEGSPMLINPMKNPESVEKLRQYVLNNHPMRGKKTF